ncbi:MAG: helix-turn-helix transcriptional regulator [Phycisphaeraceae bacterium]
MAKRKFKRLHRKLTAEQRQRFEQVRQWSQANRDTLQQGADEKLTQMEAACAAMQVLKAEREQRGISLGELATCTGIDKSNLSRALGGTLEFVFRNAA